MIKERLSVAEVLGTYIKLTKAGVNLKARCPFHNEKTPSFTVSPARNTYYCFGCGAKGDIFSFVEVFEGLDFRGALKILANRAGVEIAEESRAVRDERDRSLTLLDTAVKYYEERFQEMPEAISYLVKRGAEKETLQKFHVGFALDEWHGVESYLRKKGFKESEMIESGLVIRGPKGTYDRFRSRILFPIGDMSGRIIAFSGRIFETAGRPAKDIEAKYINSPETPLFSKSHVLYGYDKAKLSIRKWNFSIVVEGQMDLLMSHQAGYGNTVAPSGTALTGEQLALIKRLSSNVVLAFDADGAGLKATERSAHLALGMGMDVKVAMLPPQSDPADLIAADPNVWKEAIKNAKHVVEFYLETIAAQGKDMRALRLEVGRVVLPFVKQIPNKIDQSHFVSRIASRLSVEVESVRDELRRLKFETINIPIRVQNENVEIGAERASIDRMVWNVILWQRTLPEPAINLSVVEKRLRDIYGKEGMERELAAASTDLDNRIFEAEEEWGDGRNLSGSLEDMFYRLIRGILEERFAAAKSELQRAEESGDAKRIEKAFLVCSELSKQLSKGVL